MLFGLWPHRKSLTKRKIFPGKFSQEEKTRMVDGQPKCANLVTRTTAGTPLIGSSFYVHLGLQIGLNFVPASAKATAAKPPAEEENRVARLSFFVALNVHGSWFFDIYIQGSKKVQL